MATIAKILLLIFIVGFVGQRVERFFESDADRVVREATEAAAAAEHDARRARIKEEEDRVEASCLANSECVGKRHREAATIACLPAIGDQARYDHKWTTRAGAFDYWRWRDKEAGVLTYSGDALQLQNGSGAWQRYSYECDYDFETEAVLNVRTSPL